MFVWNAFLSSPCCCIKMISLHGPFQTGNTDGNFSKSDEPVVSHLEQREWLMAFASPLVLPIY